MLATGGNKCSYWFVVRSRQAASGGLLEGCLKGAWVVKRGKAHPGFKAVQEKVMGEGYSREAAGRIVAAAARNASAKAKRANPRLKRVKGA